MNLSPKEMLVLSLAVITLAASFAIAQPPSRDTAGFWSKLKNYLGADIKRAPARRITPIEEDADVKRILSREYKYVRPATRWPPKEFRREEDKTLLKIFPFPRINEAANYPKIKPPVIPPAQKGKWEHYGVQGIGVVTSVDFSKVNNMHLLMGTEASGLYKSYNFGKSWQKIENFPHNDIQMVAIGPFSPQPYIQLADERYVVLADKGHKLYSTNNGGATWELEYEFDGSCFGCEVFWYGSRIVATNIDKLIYSEDNGINWQEYQMPHLENMYGGSGDLKLRPTGEGLYALNFPKNWYGKEFHGLYRTKDFGKTWALIKKDEEKSFFAYDISDDGQIISAVVAKAGEKYYLASEMAVIRSADGGKTWTTTKIESISSKIENWGYSSNIDLYPQDLVIDPQDPNHLYIYFYMDKGPSESFDGGKAFQLTIDKLDVITLAALKQTGNIEESWAIVPLDLRYGRMKYVTGGAFGTEKKRGWLLPTDQGLFFYDPSSKTMSAISRDVYLADTGRVTITSCPRLYTGFWHVGGLLIDENGKMYKTATYENLGARAEKDKGCDTSVIWGSGNYSSDGVKLGPQETSEFIWNNVEFSYGYHDYQYYDGWWYFIDGSRKSFVRLNLNSKQVEDISPSANDKYYSFYIDQSSPKTTFWLFGDNRQFSTTDFKTWTEFPQSEEGIREILYKNGPTIIVQDFNGTGIRVKNGDISDTWSTLLKGSGPSYVIKDKCGNLFIGLEPVWEDSSAGVWWSSDKGQSWYPFGEGAEKSFVTGLAIDETTQTLYAATAGESLLRIPLPECVDNI